MIKKTYNTVTCSTQSGIQAVGRFNKAPAIGEYLVKDQNISYLALKA